MIEVEHLTKDYGTMVAVVDLSFSVGKGEIVGFLGPNGAGKTTTLRILAGFLGATSGSVKIAGIDIAERPLEARRVLGYMPEAAPLYPELRVREYLRFRARLKRVPRAKQGAAIEDAMRRAAVSDVADTVVSHLSKGYRQRVGLADALVSDPPLLILDEPTAGLDPNQIREVRKLVRELAQDHTILLSTHILSEVEATCDRALVIHRGRLVAEGSLEELQAGRRSRAIVAWLRDPEGRAETTAKALPNVARVAIKAGSRKSELVQASVEFQSPENAERGTEELVAAWVQAGVFVREVTAAHPSLEEVFAELTRAEDESEQPSKESEA